MSRPRHATESLPACYAMVQPGIEPIASAEISKRLGGEIKRTAPGTVVFRLPQIDASILELRTTEDVFLLAWGTDELSYRAEDLERIRRWTMGDADWPQLLRIHHSIRPKPKGRPNYHIVTQMTGVHGYRRVDARKALVKGLAGKLPPSWPEVNENAALEIWLTIHEATAVCGVRLSDRTMRHRTYKIEHQAASLRPTVAGAMVHLARIKSGEIVLDPMCGAGTILAEAAAAASIDGLRGLRVCGGDISLAALRAARSNLRRLDIAFLACWDARRLPLVAGCCDAIISNPPFGKQLSRPEDIGPLYQAMVVAYDRVLRVGGRAVLLVGDAPALRKAARFVGWKQGEQYPVRVLGQRCLITIWRKVE